MAPAKKGGTKAKAPAQAGDNGQVISPDELPRAIVAKGGLTKSNLLQAILSEMDGELWISHKQAKEFTNALERVVEREIKAGNPVNLFGIVKLKPRLHTAGKRLVNKEFGSPEAGKSVKKYKAKVTLKAEGIGKKFKDALPSVKKMEKRVAED